jgi:hypothetical protein
MSVDYVQIVVRPTIPSAYLADIEAWLLTRAFQTEAKGDRLSFQACWSLNDIFENILSPDQELGKALASSREICRGLCVAVERAILKSDVIMLGAVDYESIFQSIIQRHPDLQHISIEECDCNTRAINFDQRFTLITADAIESIRTVGVHEKGHYKGVKIVRRSGALKPESPYILFSKEDVS